jgi:cysteine synthase
MDIRQDFVDAVGHTPLIKLRQASELTGCTILGKAEFLNPGGSVKDRAAKYMVLDGERRGVIEPGGLIVEGTAGNTGIGLALVGASRGYRTLILMPNTQSQEKKDALRLCGAELREVPAVPYKDPNNYVHIAARTAKELEATEQHSTRTSGTTTRTATGTRPARRRRFGRRPTARSTASSAPSAPAARWPASARS